MKKALVVLSGGQDSTTCLYWAKTQYDEIHAITFDYGQRHDREIHAAGVIAIKAGVQSHVIVPVQDILESASPLVSKTSELETYSDFDSMSEIIGDRIEKTFVPMRNAFFLTIAANRAIALGCRTLVTGVCQEDNANYPDCRYSFITAQAYAINQALGINDFEIKTPLIYLSKAQSVELAMSLPGCMEALGNSHTCYAGEFPPCGKCHSCLLRAEGFKIAGMLDPLYNKALAA